MSTSSITGGGSTNLTAGRIGITAPLYAGVMGVIDGSGNVQGASATNPVRVDPTGTTVQPVSGVITPTTSTGIAPAAASVGITSAQAVAANASRKGLILVNTSNNVISIAFGANAAVLNSGITIYPNGGAYEMDAYNFTTAAINAIAAGASSNLTVQEWQ